MIPPHRHIPFTIDLDGAQAAALGAVLSRATAVIRAAVGDGKVPPPLEPAGHESAVAAVRAALTVVSGLTRRGRPRPVSQPCERPDCELNESMHKVTP